MPAFTPLPPHTKPFARTKATELVAVVGSYEEDQYCTVAVDDATLHLQANEPAQWEWAWGAPRARNVRRKGHLIAARGDGLVITHDYETSAYAWRGTKQIRRFTTPEFAITAPYGGFVGDRLYMHLDVRVDNGFADRVAWFDVDRGKRIGPDMRGRIAPSAAGPAVMRVNDHVHVVDPTTLKVKRDIKWLPTWAAHDFAVSPDGAYAAFAGAEVKRGGMAWGRWAFLVLDLARGRPVADLKGHKKEATSVAFVGRGRFVATLATDQVLRLWSVPKFELVDEISLKRAADQHLRIAVWDAHDAFVVAGNCGVAYVFSCTRRPPAPTFDVAQLPRLLADYAHVNAAVTTEHGETTSRPQPPASKRAIDAYERELGVALPPSYRAFLRCHDGWQHFWGAMWLRGTAGATARYVTAQAKQARAVRRGGGGSDVEWFDPKRHIVIGADDNGGLLALGAEPADNGEREVLDIPRGFVENRFPTFGDFVAAQLGCRRKPTRKPPVSG